MHVGFVVGLAVGAGILGVVVGYVLGLVRVRIKEYDRRGADLDRYMDDRP